MLTLLYRMKGRLIDIHPTIVMDAWPMSLECDRCGSADVDMTVQTSAGRRRGQVLSI